MIEPEFEYIDLELTVEKSVVTDCFVLGEGRQIKLLTKPIVLVPADGVPYSRELARLARRIVRALTDKKAL